MKKRDIEDSKNLNTSILTTRRNLDSNSRYKFLIGNIQHNNSFDYRKDSNHLLLSPVKYIYKHEKEKVSEIKV